MATRSPCRGSSRPTARKRRRSGPAGEAAPGAIEDVSARAARLGITPERVLQEYAHIAFADVRHLVEWQPGGGFKIKDPDLWGDDGAAVLEIVPGSDNAHARVKLHDKRPALDAIARHLGMFPAVARRREPEAPTEPAEDPRAELERRLARLAADAAEK